MGIQEDTEFEDILGGGGILGHQILIEFYSKYRYLHITEPNIGLNQLTYSMEQIPP
jgi:hypothetical protein